MNGINYNFLGIFLEVADSKSFLAAANKLYISQPAVSRSIAKLESDLGVVLFYRANKGITLTSSGEVLYKYLNEIKSLLDSCNRVLVSINDIEEGNIIIGVQSHIVRNYLMAKIDDFCSKHPKIKISLIDSSTTNLLDMLKDRKIDFVVDSSPVNKVYNNMAITPIQILSTCFIKSAINNQKITKLSDLQKTDLILPAERSSLRKNLNKVLLSDEIDAVAKLEFETEELIIDAVRRNLGIGYVLEGAIEYLVNARIIDKIELKEELPKLEINLITIDNYLNNLSKIFIEEELLNGK